jgi:hypothetical protein
VHFISHIQPHVPVKKFRMKTYADRQTDSFIENSIEAGNARHPAGWKWRPPHHGGRVTRVRVCLLVSHLTKYLSYFITLLPYLYHLSLLVHFAEIFFVHSKYSLLTGWCLVQFWVTPIPTARATGRPSPWVHGMFHWKFGKRCP